MDDQEIILKIADRVDDIRKEQIEVRKDISEIAITMAANTASLQEHMRRTNLLEEQMKPVTAHVAMFNGVVRFMSILSILGGIIAAILKGLGHL